MSEPTAPRVSVKSRNRKDLQLLDLDQSTTDPNRHYRWVRVRKDEHNMSVTKHKLRGYSLEKRSDKGGVKTLAETDNRPDGVIAIGDLVLMSCPMDVYEERVRARLSRNEALLASTSAQTEKMAKEKGISIIKDADHGSTT